MANLRKKPITMKVFGPIIALLLIIFGGLIWIKTYLVESRQNPNGVRLQNGQYVQSASTVPLALGSQIADLDLTRLDGVSLKLSQMNQKIYLVNFWASWCEGCMSEMESLVRLREAYHSRGVEIISINLDENSQIVVPKVKEEFGIEFPLFKDVNGQLSDVFDVHAIPLSVVLDQKRHVLLIQDGELDWNSTEFRNQLEKWLSE
jgi:thiol-disulfide isomerase/thioredoxin